MSLFTPSRSSGNPFLGDRIAPASKPKPSVRCRVGSPRMSLPPPLTALTNLLWGPSLPPGLLISTVRTAWTTTWRLMMSQLAPSDPTGGYSRPPSKFRATNPSSLLFSASGQHDPRPGSLHLYVGLPCPWAHRALIVRALKGLEDAVPVSVANPGIDGSWEFTGKESLDSNSILPGIDKANGCRNLKEVYRLRRGGYSGRSTVPMLWDVEKKEIACNESYDIVLVFNSGLNSLATNPELDLYPPPLKAEIERWNRVIYPNINNGVYRCGFAQNQEAYDSAVTSLFDTLDMVDEHLSKSRYLCGDDLTVADVCLFTTLIRFDLVYNVLFKCTKKKLLEYPNLHGYLCDIYQIPNIAETCDFAAIMEGYYEFLFPLNPGNIRPIMPSGCEDDVFSRPHNRASLSFSSATSLLLKSS